jgi:signal peptidase I
VGDLIIVQGTPPEQIYANYLNGDIIVFRRPGNPTDLIVHRAVMKEPDGTGWLFTTKGDNNPSTDSWGKVPDSSVIGKVIGKFPWVGNFALIMHTRENMYLFAVVIIVIIVILLTLPFGSGKDETKSDQDGNPKERRKLFGKIDIKTIYLLVVNVLLIIFLVFGLWGAFTFWQPGANMPNKSVTIYGMYSDVQFYESFTVGYNHVEQIYLSSGFLTYTVNAYATDGANTGLRTGVPAFSWAQAAIIVLLIIDVWELVQFLRAKRKAKTATAET